MPRLQWFHRTIQFALILGLLAGCATTQPRVFDAPAPAVPTANKKLFEDAYKAQHNGQYHKAIGLWKQFLQAEPNSFEARNNLGMVFYAEDRLPESIAEFQTALQLAPQNDIILRNLSRSLQFQVALLKENREYERAIEHLKTLQTISPAEDFQKVQFMIEEMEDRVFEQVQNANTVEEYQRFLKRHPRGVNAEKARQKLAELEDKHSSLIHSFEDRQPITKEGVLEKIEQDAPPTPGIQEETVDALPPPAPEPGMEPMPGMEGAPPSEISEAEVVNPQDAGQPMESPRQEEPVTAESVPPVVEETPAPPVVAEAPAETPAPPPPVQPEPPKMMPAKVMVTLNNPKSVLRVRAMPTTNGKILTRLKNGEIRPLIQENAHWYQIEYAKGQRGWISKKFSRKLESGSTNAQPQAHLKRAGGQTDRAHYPDRIAALAQP